MVSEPLTVITVLGSCVALTFFERKHGLAAICHAMLPTLPHREKGSLDEHTRFRYLDFAVRSMIDAYRLRGIDFETIEAKMFGGAAVIGRTISPLSGSSIGETNVELARHLLLEAGIAVRAENVGGTSGRKIIFNTATGEVLHKQFSTPIA